MAIPGQPPSSTITSKGQATIPKAVRDHLGVRPGDRLKFFIQPDGHVVLLPKLPASAVRGMLKYDGPPITVEEMNDAVAEAAVERYLRASQDDSKA